MIPSWKISKTHLDIYWWLFQVVIVLGLACVVVWLSLIPKIPIFTVTNINIPAALDIQNSTLGGTEVVVVNNISVFFNLEISNPNRGVGIYYHHIHATVYYNNSVLGMKSIPAFYQRHKKARLTDVLVNVDQKLWRKNASGHIDFKMALETAVKYRIFRWNTKNHPMDFEAFLIVCTNGTVAGEKQTKLHQK
ncbi:protein NDR1-like [Cornus florida]|uniref:protein NDR1-like n=1 Tax=Cornus florida TaxID=4283 RepID=UPI0028A0259C|nr:protein NDR1-like [Cornus florida]